MNTTGKRRLLAVGFAALVVVALCSAGTLGLLVVATNTTPTRTIQLEPLDTPSSATATAVPLLGVGNIALRVAATSGTTLITLTAVERRTTGCDPYAPAPTHGAYLVTTVTLTVISGTASVNPLYFVHVAPNGITADMIGGILSGCGTSLASGTDLPAGTVRQGQVVFDLDPGNLGQIAYVSPLGTPYGSWDIR